MYIVFVSSALIGNGWWQGFFPLLFVSFFGFGSSVSDICVIHCAMCRQCVMILLLVVQWTHCTLPSATSSFKRTLIPLGLPKQNTWMWPNLVNLMINFVDSNIVYFFLFFSPLIRYTKHTHTCIRTCSRLRKCKQTRFGSSATISQLNTRIPVFLRLKRAQVISCSIVWALNISAKYLQISNASIGLNADEWIGSKFIHTGIHFGLS